MKGDFHERFCENLRVKLPWVTRLSPTLTALNKSTAKMKLTRLFNEFFESEKASRVLLIFCTAVSLLLANSFVADNYLHLWHFQIAKQSSEYWINDGLMTVFFLLIGLALERAILSSIVAGTGFLWLRITLKPFGNK